MLTEEVVPMTVDESLSTDQNNNQEEESSFPAFTTLNLADNVTKPSTQSMPFVLTSTNHEQSNKPVKEETQNLDELAKNNQMIDKFYDTNLNKKWNLLDKFANRTMFDAVQEVKADLFKTTSNYRLGFYKSLLDTRLDSLHEKCGAGVKMIKGHYRHMVSVYLLGKLEELSIEIRNRQISFLEQTKAKYQYAETCVAYPSLYKRFTESIISEEIRYLQFLDGLMSKFEAIVDEELKKY